MSVKIIYKNQGAEVTDAMIMAIYDASIINGALYGNKTITRLRQAMEAAREQEIELAAFHKTRMADVVPELYQKAPKLALAYLKQCEVIDLPINKHWLISPFEDDTIQICFSKGFIEVKVNDTPMYTAKFDDEKILKIINTNQQDIE